MVYAAPMPSYTRLEISVGLFVVAGVLAMAYLALTLAGLSLGAGRYTLTARFSSVGDLKVGDPVKLAGVDVGNVAAITLDEFTARAELSLREGVKLPSDTIASIKTAGLLGDAYVALSPGAASSDLPVGGRISRTEPAVSITELIAKYAFGSPIADEGEKPKSDTAAEPKKSPFSDPLE